MYSYDPSGATFHQEKIIETKKRVLNEGYGGESVKNWISVINTNALDNDEKDRISSSTEFDRYIAMEFQYGWGFIPNKTTEDILGYEKLMLLVITQGNVDKYPTRPIGTVGRRKHFYSKNVSPESYYNTLNQLLINQIN